MSELSVSLVVMPAWPGTQQKVRLFTLKGKTAFINLIINIKYRPQIYQTQLTNAGAKTISCSVLAAICTLECVCSFDQKMPPAGSSPTHSHTLYVDWVTLLWGICLLKLNH